MKWWVIYYFCKLCGKWLDEDFQGTYLDLLIRVTKIQLSGRQAFAVNENGEKVC